MSLSGLVVREQSGFYWVETPDNVEYVCRLRGRLKEDAQASDIVAIGDTVTFVTVQEDGVSVLSGAIESVAERRSVLSRAVRTEGKRGVGQQEREQVLIANVDQCFFVMTPSHPAPNFRMLDRMLVSGEKANIETLFIVVNKIDLSTPEEIETLTKPYRDMGYTILQTSALHAQGIDTLRQHLKDRISLFTGQSGVGKTSLLNQVQPNLGRVVKSIGESSEEGMHTTRDSALVKLDSGGYLADTPGIRRMALWDVEPSELDGYFRDIATHVGACKFRNCTHTNEPACAVRRAVKKGEIARHRYENFLHLRDEIADTYIVY